jgi:DNA (cytosine-5)-methyltransferase 1
MSYDIAICTEIDGTTRARRIEPGTMPLATGLPNRVGLIRGYGNAIVPQLAATFIRAFLETEGEA